MRTTPQPRVRLDLLRPASIFVFLGLVVLWIVLATAPDWDAFAPRAVARVAGYVGLIAMLVPYLHIVRRSFRYRQGRAMTFWLRMHIGASYLAFFMVLLHSRGRANGPLTLTLLWLTWIVMVSGVVGYFGQKLLYLLMPRVVAQELGMERLEPQRRFLLAEAEKLGKKKEVETAPEVIRAFFAVAVTDCLAPAYSLLGGPRRGDDMLSDNGFERAHHFGDDKQRDILRQVWDFVKMRREMNLEYRLHQIGRSWLLVHGPAAWALLVLMVEHVVMSLWYGGF
jgi:hypothetical protein